MSHRIDDIVRVLSDEGQSSGEEGHPEDRGVVPDGVCWRCVRREVAPGHDLCGACRSFLLGDTEIDPVEASSAGDHAWPHDDELLLGQSSYVTDLFDETAHELVAHHLPEVAVALRGGISDGMVMRVPPARDGGPPAELFTPVGMEHGAVRTERYVLDDASGPGLWSYDLAEPDDGMS